MLFSFSTGLNLLLSTKVLLELTLTFICLIKSLLINKSEPDLGLASNPTSISLYVNPLNVKSNNTVGLVSDGSSPSAFALYTSLVPCLGLEKVLPLYFHLIVDLLSSNISSACKAQAFEPLPVSNFALTLPT